MNFYGNLDPEIDQYFIEQLQPELLPIRKTILAEIARDLQQAETSWSQYQGMGGIKAILRLENTVSPQFIRRAAELSLANQMAQRAAARATWLGAESGSANAGLRLAVQSEVKQQRNALADFVNALGRGLVEQKLILLPTPD